MKANVIKIFIKDIFMDYENVILDGLEENQKELPYSTACINFLYELKEKELNISMSYFSEELREIIYNEIKKYITR